jgi:hypothetical protein
MLITSGFLSKKRANTRAIVVKIPIAIETPVAKRKALFFPCVLLILAEYIFNKPGIKVAIMVPKNPKNK